MPRLQLAWAGVLLRAPWLARTQDEQTSYDCANPLFRGHWYAARTDTAHLGREPIIYDDLVRCKVWNKRESCCNPSMEVPQQVAFDSRRADFERHADMLRDYLGDLNRIQGAATYRHAEPVERALLDRAMEAMRRAVVAHGRCKKALLEFTAGMICFGCDPSWHEYVWRTSDGSVVGVDISSEVCIYVDRHCNDFGRSALWMQEQIMDSGLAKLPAMPLPDLAMFRNREALCQWLREVLAMSPLPGFVQPSTRLPAALEELPVRRLDTVLPNGETIDIEQVSSSELPAWALKLLPTTAAPSPARLAAPPAPPPYATTPRLSLDPIFAGQRSGFHFEEEVTAASAPGSLFD